MGDDVLSEDFEPEIEQILSIYQQLNDGKIPELQWKSKGYRTVTPPKLNESKTAESSDCKLTAADELKNEFDKTDFDFDDDDNNVSSVDQKSIKKSYDGPKGSAKKRTTSLASVLSNIGRHYQLTKKKSNSKD